MNLMVSLRSAPEGVVVEVDVDVDVVGTPSMRMPR